MSTKFNGNPSDIHEDISVDNKNVNLVVEEEVGGSSKSVGSSCGNDESLHRVMAIHLIAVEIFLSGPKWWTFRLTLLSKAKNKI